MQNQQNKNDEYRYLSVSEYAKTISRSTTHVYNLIADGKIDTIPYARGNYNGYVIRLKK